MRLLQIVTLLSLMGLTPSCRMTGSENLSDPKDNSPCEQAETDNKLKGKEIYSLTKECLFNDDVHTILIQIHGQTMDKVLGDGCNGIDSGYGHVHAFTINGKKFENVGIKVRGNTSRCNEKRQFKIKFNPKKAFRKWNDTVVWDKKYKKRRAYGLNTLNLRASTNDPSMIRERLSSEIFNQVENLKPTFKRGGPAYRVSFAKVFITFEQTEPDPDRNFTRKIGKYYYDYRGLYSLAEDIDDVFIKSRLGNAPGVLFKGNLAKATFLPGSYHRNHYETEEVILTDEQEEAGIDEKEHADALMKKFIEDIKNANSEDDWHHLVNVDSFLNYVAGIALTGHWDSLIGNANNDLIFYNEKTKKWQIIVWDLDNTLGVQMVSWDQGRNQFHFHGNRFIGPGMGIFHLGNLKFPLFERLLHRNNPNFRAQLKDRLRKAVTPSSNSEYGFFSKNKMNERVTYFRKATSGHVESWEGYNPIHYEPIYYFSNMINDKLRDQLRD